MSTSAIERISDASPGSQGWYHVRPVDEVEPKTAVTRKDAPPSQVSVP
jgi:hypothetical protein